MHSQQSYTIPDYTAVTTEVTDQPHPRSHRQMSQRDVNINHMRSASSLHQTPNSFNRTTRTPLNRRDASAHSSIKKTLLTETINKKEEDLLKRLTDLQSLGTNQALKNKNEPHHQSASQLSSTPDNQKQLNSDGPSHSLLNSYQGLIDAQRDVNDELLKSGSSRASQSNQYRDLEIEHKIKDEDRNFLERMKNRFLTSNAEQNSNQNSAQKELIKSQSSPVLSNQAFQQNVLNLVQPTKLDYGLYHVPPTMNMQTMPSENPSQNQSRISIESSTLISYKQQPVTLNKEEDYMGQINRQKPPTHIQARNQFYQYKVPEPKSDLELLEEIRQNERMFEEMENQIDLNKNRNSNNNMMPPPIPIDESTRKKKVKRGSKQKIIKGSEDEMRRSSQVRSPRQSQPLSPQQRGYTYDQQPYLVNQQQHNVILDGRQLLQQRKRWQQDDRQINELLNKLQVQQIEFTNKDQQVLFSLTRQVQSLQKKVDSGDYEETQRLQRELNLEKDVVLKNEQKIYKLEQFIENLKHHEKKEIVDTQNQSKVLEKQIKDIKNKMMVSENLVSKKQMEIELLKQKLEKKMHEDDKYLIRDRNIFEKHFGRQPRPAEEKAYDIQREKLEKQVELLEREVDRLNAQNLELQNENYALSKGQIPAEEAHYFKKGDGGLTIKIRELENENQQLQKALKQNANDFKDLLKEIDQQKKSNIERDQQMEAMEQEMKIRPNLSSMKATQMKMQEMEQEIKSLQKQNDELNNEIMIFRNNSVSKLQMFIIFQGTHINQKSQQKNEQIKGGLLIKNNQGSFMSAGDARMIIEEIQEILKLETEDPGQIIETIRKLEKVVKAVPRMENFIQNICKQMSEDPNRPTPIEQIIPQIQYLRDIAINQAGPLQQFKRDLIYLLFQRDNINMQNQDLIMEIERLIIEKEQMKQQSVVETESQRAFKYILELFESKDSTQLLDKVNQTFVYVNEFNTFMRIIRGILQMDNSITVTTCLNAVRNIVIGYTQGQIMRQQ
ncbi:UNKNOWN [Stylonychia lemnae]|uniref:Centrosomal protein of 70 kDa n=1 Tax=Stylonychia lemnae TaxID=5949 RepID=A0A078ASD8_STYLE|nr:UNKNOWN [Stylonychia lemnae]|eukprot:CDW84876.1 UNKNOWN [Stylonychia lemnae]